MEKLDAIGFWQDYFQAYVCSLAYSMRFPFNLLGIGGIPGGGLGPIGDSIGKQNVVIVWIEQSGRIFRIISGFNMVGGMPY
jgi:hypothetical protein